jgi:cytochrome b6-f complex iron-sulfur subunit
MWELDESTHLNSNCSTMEITRIKASRRTALIFLFCTALIALLTKLSRVAFSFLEPPKTANSFGGIFDVGAVHELPQAGSAPVANTKGRFWLVNDDLGLRAIHSTCTHLQCLFSWDQEKQLFVCPCHGSEFSRDGAVLRGPATRDLDSFPILLVDEDDQILSQTDKESAAPVAVAQYLPKPSESAPLSGEEEQRRVVVTVRVDTGLKIAGLDRSSVL